MLFKLVLSDEQFSDFEKKYIESKKKASGKPVGVFIGKRTQPGGMEGYGLLTYPSCDGEKHL